MHETAWTVILWDIGTGKAGNHCIHDTLRDSQCPHDSNHAENVPVPSQLWDNGGIKKLRDLFKNSFAKSRRLQLHCIKLACCWPDHRSAYADLLGKLVLLGDVEALAYQYPGQEDMLQVSNKLLKQVSLLVMTSDQQQAAVGIQQVYNLQYNAGSRPLYAHVGETWRSRASCCFH